MKKYVSIIVIMVAFSSSTQAESFNIPNTFVANTKATANEVNENFNAVQTAINDNDSKIALNANSINSLNTDVTNLLGTLSDDFSGDSSYLTTDSNGNLDINGNLTVGENTTYLESKLSVYGFNGTGVIDENEVNKVTFMSDDTREPSDPGTLTGGLWLMQDANVFHILTGRNDNGSLAFSTRSNYINQEKMRLTNSGNFGIGTTTPNSKLQVSGYIQLATTSGASPDVEDCDNATEYGRMKVDEINSLIYICTLSGWIGK